MTQSLASGLGRVGQGRTGLWSGMGYIARPGAALESHRSTTVVSLVMCGDPRSFESLLWDTVAGADSPERSAVICLIFCQY